MSSSISSQADDSARLNKAAAHDTGLYEHGRQDNQIVALYETDALASDAQEMLLKAGVPAEAVQLVPKGQGTGTLGGVNAEDRDSSFWTMLRNILAPPDAATTQDGGMAHNHSVLVVRPPADMDRQKLVRMIESTEPVDFDARLEEWRQAGYDTVDPRGTTAQADARVDSPADAAGMALRPDASTSATATPAATGGMNERRGLS